MNNNRFTLGITLVLFGILTMLDNFGVISASFEKISGYLLLLYAIPTFYYSFSSGKRNRLLASALIFFVGIIFLVKGYFQILDERGLILASILFISGAVLLILYLENVKEKIFLISGIALILFSGLAITLFKNLGLFNLSAKISGLFEIFWPVVLIVFGISLFINRRK
jgi:hypothetical protein